MESINTMLFESIAQQRHLGTGSKLDLYDGVLNPDCCSNSISNSGNTELAATSMATSSSSTSSCEDRIETFPLHMVDTMDGLYTSSSIPPLHHHHQQQYPPTIATTRPRRKRVRFETEDVESTAGVADPVEQSSRDATDPPVKKRVIQLLPLSSELSPEEKGERWILSHEWKGIHRAIKEELKGQPSLPAAAQTFVHVYSLCQENSILIDESHSVDGYIPDVMPILPLLATSGSDVRGLEDVVVPRLGIQRRLARVSAIRAVIHAQRHSQPDSLRTISRVMSNSARQLGQVLAVADATAAMLEYSNTM